MDAHEKIDASRNREWTDMIEGKLPFAVVCVSIGTLTILPLTVFTISASDLLMSVGWGVSVIALGLISFGSWLVDRARKSSKFVK
jgi:hypothetical protein